MKTKHASAFTLIELLVVVAIVGVLASLLLSALGRVKAHSQQVTCANKIKQWGLAMRMYADENEDAFPREDGIDGVNPWVVAAAATNSDVWYNCLAREMPARSVADYAANPLSGEFYSESSMFRCPSAKFQDNANTYPMFSIAMNSQLIGFGVPVTMMSIEDPSHTVIFLDCGVPKETLACDKQREYNGQPKAYANRFSGRHSDSGNLGMADGSVARHAVSRVVDPKTGRSFFPPKDVVWCTTRDQQP